MSAAAAVLVWGPADGRAQMVRLDSWERPPGELCFREGLEVRSLAAHVERGAAYVPPRIGLYRLQAVDGKPAVNLAGDLVYGWCGWQPG